MASFDDLTVDSLTIRGTRAGDNVTLSGLSDLTDLAGGGGGGGLDASDPPRLLAGATDPLTCTSGSTVAVVLNLTVGVSGTSAIVDEDGGVSFSAAGVYHLDAVGTWAAGIGACSLTMGATVTAGDALNPGINLTGPPASPNPDAEAVSAAVLSETLFIPAGATVTVTALQTSGSDAELTVAILRVTRLL